MIFDEATSALDNETEAAVMEAIDAMAGKKTVVLIAHRLSTVQHCEQVIVLDKGRIVARGKFSLNSRRSRGSFGICCVVPLRHGALSFLCLYLVFLMLLVSTNLSFLPDLAEAVRISGGFQRKDSFRASRRVAERCPVLSIPSFPCLDLQSLPNVYQLGRRLAWSSVLRWNLVVTPSTGTNHIDVAWCEANGIAVRSLRGSEVVDSITASSEFTFALMLAMLRSLPQSAKGALRGEWREVEDRYRGREMSSLTLGIIGLGRIGSNVARYAQAMGTRIMAHDPYRDSDRVWPDYVERVDNLDSLLESSDVVQVSVHLAQKTAGMIDSAVFAKMKQGSFFVEYVTGGDRGGRRSDRGAGFRSA